MTGLTRVADLFSPSLTPSPSIKIACLQMHPPVPGTELKSKTKNEKNKSLAFGQFFFYTLEQSEIASLRQKYFQKRRLSFPVLAS